MDRYTINISDLAKQDIRDISTYISDQLIEPDIADNTIETILDAISSLDFMPARTPLVRDQRLARVGIRGMQVKDYTVFYRVNDAIRAVDVVRVLYSRRDWQGIL